MMPKVLKDMVIWGIVNWASDVAVEYIGKAIDHVKDRYRRVLVYEQGNTAYTAFNEWFYIKYPATYKNVESKFKTVRNGPKVEWDMYYDQLDSTSQIVYQGHKIRIIKSSEFVNKGKDRITQYKLECYTSKTILTKLANEIYKYWTDKHKSIEGLHVIITDKWFESKDVFINSYKKIDQMFVDNKEDLISDIKDFMSRKPLYKEKGIKFKRGYLLYGPPGTGKTSLVFAIADMLNMPIYYLNPTEFTDGTFEDFMASVESKSIILIEDCDIFWTNRDDVNDKAKTNVSFQSLLNVMDGIHSPDECLIFLTTNHKHRFDEALMRKGRLDFHFKVDFPSREVAEAYISNFYGVKVYLPEEYKSTMPAVDIQDLCLNNEDPNKVIDLLIKKT